MAIKDRMSGNEAVATAMRQINPDVMGAFPITPSTEIPQYFSKYIADGKVDTEFVAVESEHSAMSTCIGASAAGARAITATSSAGLAFMWELLYAVSYTHLRHRPDSIGSRRKSCNLWKFYYGDGYAQSHVSGGRTGAWHVWRHGCAAGRILRYCDQGRRNLGGQQGYGCADRS